MNNNSERIAIVLPVFNVENYLQECLNSIRNQDYKNFTVFAVNDGSTDNSGIILDEYSRIDKLFLKTKKKNEGVSAARNTALEAIEKNGSFDGICFIDGDDYIKQNFLSTFITLSRRYNADYVVSAWESFDKTGTVNFIRNHSPDPPNKCINTDEAYEHFIYSSKWKNKTKTCSFFCSNRYFSSQTIHGIRFDTSLKSGEDQDFLIRAISRIKRGVITNTVTYMYRIRASSISHFPTNYLCNMLFSHKLLKQLEKFPTSGIRIIEYLACKYWWACTYLSIIDGSFPKKRPKIDEAYKNIRSHNFHNKDILNKYKNKIFIYSLGIPALYIYSFLKKKKIKKTSLNAFP